MDVPQLKLKLTTLYQHHPHIHQHQALADVYGVDVHTIYIWIRKNHIPAKRIQVFKQLFSVDESLLALTDCATFDMAISRLYGSTSLKSTGSHAHPSHLYWLAWWFGLILVSVIWLLWQLSFLATIWLLGVTILGLFMLAQELLTQSANKQLSDFLRASNIHLWFDRWPAMFTELFDRVFGQRHASLNCFYRSSLASLVSLFCCYWILKGLYPDAYFFHSTMFYSALWVVFLGIVFNLIPDYLSLLQTRFILARLIKLPDQGHGLKMVGLLILDFLLTSVIFIVYFSFFLMVLELLHLVCDPNGYVMMLIVDIAAKVGIGNTAVGQEVQVIPLVVRIFQDAFSASGLAGEVSIFLYTTYLTSIWLYLFLLGASLLRYLARFQTLFRRLSTYIKIEEAPLLSTAYVIIVPLLGLSLLAYSVWWIMVDHAQGTGSLPSVTQNSTITSPVKPDLFPRMIFINQGQFRMGDLTDTPSHHELPIRTVSVNAFYMSETEVTVSQFRHFVKSTDYQVQALNADAVPGCQVAGVSSHQPSDQFDWISPGFDQEENHPVVCISWNDAKAYVKWLSRVTGEQYDLPSEAMWEYAARANNDTKYVWGDTYLPNRAQCIGCDTPFNEDGTVPVGQFTANGFSLYDVTGNVFEWTLDNWHDNYHGAPVNDQPWSQDGSNNRVIRGGSWYSNQQNMRIAFRSFYDTRMGYNNCGFRVIKRDN